MERNSPPHMLLFGGVNFSQKHNYNMAKMMVFIAEQKLHVSAYIGHLQVFTTSLLKSLI